MKYTISMNQKIIIDSGLELDITDGAIIDFIHSFCHSDDIQKLIHAGKIYYWISYDLVADQLPILRLKKDTVYRKFKFYIEIGLLDAHPDNKQLNRAYFAINPLFLSLFYSGDNLRINSRTHRKDSRSTYGNDSASPTDKNPIYNNTINNGIKDNGVDSKESPSHKKSIEERKKAFIALIKSFTDTNPGKYKKEMLNAFYSYWTEKNTSGRKMRFEGQKFFDLGKRLGTWAKKDAEFGDKFQKKNENGTNQATMFKSPLEKREIHA